MMHEDLPRRLEGRSLFGVDLRARGERIADPERALVVAVARAGAAAGDAAIA